MRARLDEAIRLAYRAGVMETSNDHSLGLVKEGVALVGQIFEALPVTTRSHDENVEALSTLEAGASEFADDVWLSLQVSDAVLEVDTTIDLSDNLSSGDDDWSDATPADSGEEEEDPEDNVDTGSDANAEPEYSDAPSSASLRILGMRLSGFSGISWRCWKNPHSHRYPLSHQ